MDKTLVIYYSKSGNTRKAAKKIQQMVGGDIFEVTTKKSGTSDIGDMLRLYVDPLVPNGQVSEKTELKIDAYDHIYIGTPVWGLTYSLPIKEVLRDTDFSGKKISLFCTHDGGVGKTLSAMERKAGNVQVDKTIDIISSTCRNEVALNRLLENWIEN